MCLFEDQNTLTLPVKQNKLFFIIFLLVEYILDIRGLMYPSQFSGSQISHRRYAGAAAVTLLKRPQRSKSLTTALY